MSPDSEQPLTEVSNKGADILCLFVWGIGVQEFGLMIIPRILSWFEQFLGNVNSVITVNKRPLNVNRV